MITHSNESQNFLWRLVLNISIIAALFYMVVDFVNHRPLSTLAMLAILIVLRSMYAKWIQSTLLKNLIKSFIVFVMFPIVYYYSVGMKGPYAYSLFLLIISLILLSENRHELIFPLSAIVMGGAFSAFEYINPDFFSNQYLQLYEGIAYMSNFILTAIALFALASTAQIYIMDTQAKLYKMSVTDELTGVYNRRFLVERLKMVAEASKQTDMPFVLIFIDINKFKQINDTFGHQKGDDILIHLGRLLKENARRQDICGRYGGDEFIVILPETTVEQAKTICTSFGEKFTQTINERLELNMPISLALGLCEGNGKSIDQIIHEADEKMYEHKVNSR